MNFLDSLKSDKKRKTLVIALTLIIITLLVFDQVREFDFVHYDDDAYVAGNAHVQSGITGTGIAWACTATDAGFWHPLTWLSLMLDYEMYGLNAGGYHGTNLILHMLNTLLLFLILFMMTALHWQSGLVAALFAIHPLHVESVAWIAERKDVLSTFFWMVTMGTYVFYVRRPGMLRYLLVVIAFCLGLMAKPMLVTLPFCLLLLDFWPLGRIEIPSTGNSRCHPIPAMAAPFRLAYVLAEKMPLIALALGTTFLVLYTEDRAGALASLKEFPFTVRISHALVSYVLYLGKTFWPVNLAVFYPHPGIWSFPAVIAATAFLLSVTFLALKHAARFPYALVGWLWYAGTLVPVIGFVQLGTQGMADRYTYIPLIGIFIIIAWGVSDISKRWRHQFVVNALLASVILSLLGYLAWRQVGFWQDAERLFTHAVNSTSKNYLAYNNLGAALARKGKIDTALVQYGKALSIKPHYADAHFNRGQALAARGDNREAEKSYRDALGIKPDFVEAHNNLAILFASQGKKDEAIAHFAAALRIRPDYEAAAENLRFLLQEQKR